MSRAFKYIISFIIVSMLVAFLYLYWVKLTVWVMADKWVECSQSKPSLGLYNYKVRIESKTIQGLSRNTSGLTYSSSTNTLFLVINRKPAVAEISTGGDLIRVISLDGATDPEGIAHVSDSLFIVSDEAGNVVHWVNIYDDERGAQIVSTHKLRLGFGNIHNLGLEGAAWDSYSSELLLANEKLPRAVLTLAHVKPLDQIQDSEVYEWNTNQWFGFLGNDISSISVHEKTGNLYLLSEESSILAEYSRSGQILGVLPLWAGYSGLSKTVPQPEGVTIGRDGTVFIVSEPNIFYSFNAN